ncbi:MAG: DUF4129 domain-containing protein [Oscillospiraceae bacterium]|nr:DUF4129 domain-containing protein [Oscillospiraceae bacterium]
MRRYWKNYVWEYIMCIAAASMLLWNTAQTFYIPDAMADSVPLAVGACAALLFLLFLGGYNRIGLVLVPVLSASVAVLLFLLLRARGVDIVDEPGSPSAFYIYWFAFAVVCIAVYLCTRTRAGTVALLLVGAVLGASQQFLEYPVSVWPGMVFFASCIVIYILRQRRAQVMRSSTAAPDFFRFFRSAVCVVLAAAALSIGIFFALIRPLSPPTMELEFLERFLAFDIIEHTGIADQYQVPDEENTADQPDESGAESALFEENGDAPLSQEMDMPLPSAAPETDEVPTGETQLSVQSYTVMTLQMVVLCVLLALLVLFAPPLLRLWLRRRTMRRIAARAPAAQVTALYCLYLKKFRCLGWEKREEETPLEYAARNDGVLARYLEGSCGLDALTAAFLAAYYAGQTPTEEQCAVCRAIYSIFLKNCRRQMGALRYALKFYQL